MNSTIMGYLLCDDITMLKQFRMTREELEANSTNQSRAFPSPDLAWPRCTVTALSQLIDVTPPFQLTSCGQAAAGPGG